jgi:superfamily II DNA or RNA helicase
MSDHSSCLIQNKMEIENFFPKYPNIFKFEDPLLNPYQGESFGNAIVTKKEFESLKLPKFEKLATRGTGEQYNHQKIIARFMSSVTPYNELLLFHEMGTGKTCTAIAAIEQLRYEKNKHINGAIVCAKGTGLLNNFSQELLFSCTDGRYIPDNYDKLSDLERIHRTRKITSAFYRFNTFETFAKEIAKMSDEALAQRYSNTIYVIDEVHNLREKDEVVRKDDDVRNFLVNKRAAGLSEPLDIYKQFHRLFHVVKESKILLMSGTVMKDDPAEFASVMNLILPMDNQFPVDKDFTKIYFNPDGTIKNDMIETLVKKTKGRISYLKSMTSDVRKVFEGKRIGDLKHFIVYPGMMSDFQSKAYAEAYEKDKKDKSIFINSRQASLFVFPNGSYGTDGFNKYIVKRRGDTRAPMAMQRKKQETTTTYTLSSEIIKAINKNLSNLAKYSNKFAETIRIILNEPKSKVLVYCEYVNGSGCILFAKILEQFGFTSARGDERNKGRRYALLTHQTTSQKRVQQLINRFNKDDNLDGEYISVIIGSKIISEGFTLKNIRKEFIFTPHWNYSETAQVIARGWRLGSHNALIARGDQNLTVNIYQLVSIPNSEVTNTPSIDLEMYETSEKKDIAMKQIEHVVKVNTFDCPLTINRNKIVGYDGMRECDYTSCDYQCKGKIGDVLDPSTYNLYHALTNIVEDGVRKYFRNNFYLKVDSLYAMFPQLDKFEVMQAIKMFIDKDVHFLNKYGYPSYIKVQGDILYISSDARVPNNDKLADYYTKNLIIQNGDPFKYILKQIYNDEIPTFIENIFKYPDYMRTIISNLPEVVQREILTASIQADVLGIDKNKDTRKKILIFFKGFYDKIDDTWVVWLYKETLGIVCMERDKNSPGGLKWVQCHKQEPEIVDRHIAKKRTELNKSPIGFYGLYNPQLDEFCLRDIRTIRDEGDLRKITIGRRCKDWDQKTLLDIVVRKMKIEPPQDFMSDMDIEDYDTLKRKVEKMKKNNKLPDDVQNLQVMRRFLYWVKQPRINMCVKIQEWLRANNLVEENFDCGTQKKQRAKFAS